MNGENDLGLWFKVKSPAKINLFLDVLGKREDGYHEIRTIYQTISLCDEIFFTLKGKEIVVTSDSPLIPNNEDNIVFKVVKELYLKKKVRKGVEIFIKKKIPVEGGLGGGSSNAAIVLKALISILNLDISLSETLEILSRYGSDIPFFFFGGTALGVGRGDEVYPLKDIRRLYLLVGKPSVGVSTARAYEKIDKELTFKKRSLKILELVTQIMSGYTDVKEFYNVFEKVIKVREIQEIRKKLQERGAEKVLLAGSGSSLVGFFEKEKFQTLRGLEPNFIKAYTINRREFLKITTPTTFEKERFK